nr:hypothetical protein [Tanacetum cinerariifolium]
MSDDRDSCYEQNYVDNSQSPPQPQYETYSCELYGNDAHYGYDSLPQVPFVYNQDPCFNQDFDNSIPQTSPSFPQHIFVMRTARDLMRLFSHAQPEDIHEFLRKLLEDMQIIKEELAEYINFASLNCPTFYDDDDDKIGRNNKSSVENVVPILSEYEGILDDTCDVPFCDNSPPLVVLTDHFDLFFEFNDDCTSSDDEYFKDIDYVEASPPDSKLVSLEEVQDDILRKKSLNINLLIAKIESLNDNSTPDCVLKSPSPFLISVEEIDSFFEKSDTSLSYSDNSLPEFKTFSDHTEETSSGGTTTHADNSLPETRNKIFDPWIFFEVQSKRFISWDTFSISFIRNPLCPLRVTLLPFSFENEDKVFNPDHFIEIPYGEIKNGDQPLPHVTQVSIAGTTSTEQPPLKDKSMWYDQEKRVQKIDHLAKFFLIQGLPNDIYSPIDSNKTEKDLWDALARHMLGSEYGDANDAMGSKKKTVVVTSDPLALITEKINVSRNQAWMESSSDLDQEIKANMVFMAQIEKVLFDSEASSSSADEKISE